MAPKLKDLDSKILSEDPMLQPFKAAEMAAFEHGFSLGLHKDEEGLKKTIKANVYSKHLEQFLAMGDLVGGRCRILQARGVL